MLPSWYTNYKEYIDESLSNYLETYFQSETSYGLDIFKEATIYSTIGGKRIRAVLALEFYLIYTGKKFEDLTSDNDIVKYCIALELLHAYSLVHDDLPCMDNDEFRRGQLTTWKKYDDTTATLVGDLLNSMSSELVASIDNKELSSYFGKAIGVNGMLGGQVLDLFYEKNPVNLTLEKLKETHNKKTGALIDASIVGAIYIAMAENDKKQNFILRYSLQTFLDNYNDFGYNLGLAFQIKDDLLDVEGSLEETGKSVGDGEEKGFVHFLGLEKTKEYLNTTIDNLFHMTENLSSEKIDFIVKYIATRKK